MGFAGYAAVCVQLYCGRYTVLHLVLSSILGQIKINR
jgi:hypothetical protein